MLQLLALNYFHLGNYDTALNYFNKALSNTMEYNLPRVRGFVAFNLAVAHYHLGEFEDALEKATQSHELFRSVGFNSVDTSHLINVIKARIEQNIEQEIKELVKCAYETIKTPDLCSPRFFIESAYQRSMHNIPKELADEIRLFINDFNQKTSTTQ